METKITYFEKTGEENTEATLVLARQRAEELGIKKIVAASSSGATAVKAMDVFKGFNVVIVTHVFGGREPDTHDFLDSNRKIVESKGGTILTTTHGLGGISMAFQGDPPQPGRPPGRKNVLGDIVVYTLNMFGRGSKVACEITAMAADSGMVRTDEEVIAIAGTHSGADTALVIQPNNVHRFFDMKIKEIICKPRL